MSLKFTLPARLPEKNFEVEVVLRRIPEWSGVIRSWLHAPDGRSRELRAVPVYGRGQGSPATEKAYLHIPVDVQPGPSEGGTASHTLLVTAEDLAGNPINPGDLDVESLTLKPTP